ncbi:MAG: hypothetical protein ACYSTR_07880 [Planctomycetota bacterium]
MKKRAYAKNSTICLAVLFSLSFAWAHQPRLVGSETEIMVTLPEISKAYYGQLDGTPATYLIEADADFRLYVNILVPDIEGIEKDVSVKILKQGTVISHLDGSHHDWEAFFEPYAGDHYFKGPEYVQAQGPGSYQLQVYSPDNKGKYVLAVGDKEAFPFGELVRTYWVLPRLKSEFFGKSPLTAFSNRMGIFLVMMLLLMILIATLLYLGIKYIRKRRHRIKQI